MPGDRKPTGFIKQAAAGACLLAAALGGCVDSEQLDESVAQPLFGNVAGIDWHIDAPWRLEPAAPYFIGGLYAYDAIPITVSIMDGVQAAGGPDPQTGDIPAGGLGKFCGLQMFRFSGSTSNWISDRRFLPGELHEYSMEARWEHSANSSTPASSTVRLWNGQTPATRAYADGTSRDDLDPFDWSGWNAVALWSPGVTTLTPGTELIVRAVAVLAPDCNAVANLTLSGDGPRIERSTVPGSGTEVYQLRELLRIRHGYPMPRPSADWMYGDLHYHSQGTDNEGESGHSLRAVAQTMRSLGLDFAFATDHTSAGWQLDDSPVELVAIQNLDIDYLPEFLEGLIEDNLSDAVNTALQHMGFGPILSGSLRDLNDYRFDALAAMLDDPSTGVNRQAVSAPGALRAPQIFLGGESDLIPAMSQAERDSGRIGYGNGLTYNWTNVCTSAALPDFMFDLIPSGFCDNPDLISTNNVSRDGYLLKDVQLNLIDFARQHVLHLPKTPGPGKLVPNIGTGLAGGGKKSLADYIDENRAGDLAYFFLAHPVEAASGKGIDRVGPDIVPYSDFQLYKAFQSQDFLGLQVWNENDRFETDDGIGGRLTVARDFTSESQTSCLANPLGSPVWIPENGCQRTLARGRGNLGFPTVEGTGTASWFGFGSPGPLQVAPYGAGDKARLTAWQSHSDQQVNRQLFHATTTWDKMLRWGLAPNRYDVDLAWLPPSQPRRVFAAGGSDAHGDFNYRQKGYALGWQSTGSTALGTPRNLVYVGPARLRTSSAAGRTVATVSQQQVIGAPDAGTGLASGNFAVTDGPALRVAVDLNYNGVIDAGEPGMGAIHNFPSTQGSIPIVVEYKSTSEFGSLEAIDLYVGNSKVTYAPAGHGVRATNDLRGIPKVEARRVGSTSTFQWQLDDGYYKDPTGTLHITRKPNGNVLGMQGTVSITLVRSSFPAFECGAVHEVCESFLISNCPPGEICTPLCRDVCTATNVSTPTDLYVRAFARTSTANGFATAVQGQGNVRVSRYALTNPVWLHRN